MPRLESVSTDDLLAELRRRKGAEQADRVVAAELEIAGLPAEILRITDALIPLFSVPLPPPAEREPYARACRKLRTVASHLENPQLRERLAGMNRDEAGRFLAKLTG